MAREQRLVGSDHGFLRVERRCNGRSGRIPLAADQLDENVDLAIDRQRDRIGHPAQFRKIVAALLAARARRERNHLDAPAATRGERITLAIDQADHRSADRAQTGNTDLQRLRHRRAPASALG